MYAGEPIIDVVDVSRPDAASTVAAVAIPKSSTFRLSPPPGCRATNRFAGLMSRCTIPSACASASASHASTTYRAARAAGSGPRAIRFEMSSPSSSSITR